jgi:hypothetical protein
MMTIGRGTLAWCQMEGDHMLMNRILFGLVVAGTGIAFAGEAQAVELYCPKQGSPTSIVLEIDYGSNAVTYYDQFPDGHRSAPISSNATITDTTIGWSQTEQWPWQDQNGHTVTYSLSRVSGGLEYHSINGQGLPETGLRTCVSAKPIF